MTDAFKRYGADLLRLVKVTQRLSGVTFMRNASYQTDKNGMTPLRNADLPTAEVSRLSATPGNVLM